MRGCGALLAAALLLVTTPLAASASTLGLPRHVLPAPPDDVRPEPLWRERLLRLFLAGTLQDERRIAGPLAKWTGPISLSLRGAVEPYLAYVEALALELSGITGLVIEVSTDQRWHGSMDVYIAADPAWWPQGLRPADGRPQAFTCAAAPSIRAGVIRRATIRINAGVLAPEAVRACLLEEIVQSLGLLGEVEEPTDTILNDRVGYEGLGIVDRLLLRILYDDRLRPGTRGRTVREAAGLVLDEQLAGLVCDEGERPRRCALLP